MKCVYGERQKACDESWIHFTGVKQLFLGPNMDVPSCHSGWLHCYLIAYVFTYVLLYWVWPRADIVALCKVTNLQHQRLLGEWFFEKNILRIGLNDLPRMCFNGINSLACERCGCNLILVFYSHIKDRYPKQFLKIASGALKWMAQDLSDDLWTLVQVLAWCHQATSHYLSQYWLRFMFCGTWYQIILQYCMGCDSGI